MGQKRFACKCRQGLSIAIAAHIASIAFSVSSSSIRDPTRNVCVGLETLNVAARLLPVSSIAGFLEHT